LIDCKLTSDKKIHEYDTAEPQIRSHRYGTGILELGVTIYRCLQNRAPQYLVDCCMRTSDVSSRQRLRQPIGVSWSCHDIVAASSDADHSPLQLRWSGTRFQTPFGTNAEHRQLQIDIKDSPVRGATGHVAH